MNNERLQELYQKKWYKTLNIKTGNFIELHERLGDRIWRFKGLVIKTQKSNHPDGTFTIRGVTSGHTIEKVYPFSFPNFEKVILLDEYKIRKSKLYYIREKVGKDAKFKSIITPDSKELDLQALLKQEAEALLQETPEEVEEVKVEEVVETPVEEVKAEEPVEETVVEETPAETPAEEPVVEEKKEEKEEAKESSE